MSQLPRYLLSYLLIPQLFQPPIYEYLQKFPPPLIIHPLIIRYSTVATPGYSVHVFREPQVCPLVWLVIWCKNKILTCCNYFDIQEKIWDWLYCAKIKLLTCSDYFDIQETFWDFFVFAPMQQKILTLALLFDIFQHLR